jgi:putative ABC transport system permease protein
VYSLDTAPNPTLTAALGPVTDVQSLAALREDDSGRSLILTVFGAIGIVVVTVAGLAVASGLAVSVFERRHEFAALRAIGGRRRSVFHVIVAELLPLGVIGVGLGLVAGYFGGLAIAQSFERSDAVEIGFTYASGVVPIAVAVTLGGLAVLGALAMRGATRQPLAVTLRGAA